MAKVKSPYIGTELKFNVHIEPIKANIGLETEYTISMADYDFTCWFFTNEKYKIEIKKEQMIAYDTDNYIALLDTTELIYEGQIMMLIEAQIPDSDFADGFRTEKILVNTKQNIYNELFSF